MSVLSVHNFNILERLFFSRTWLTGFFIHVNTSFQKEVNFICRCRQTSLRFQRTSFCLTSQMQMTSTTLWSSWLDRVHFQTASEQQVIIFNLYWTKPLIQGSPGKPGEVYIEALFGGITLNFVVNVWH